MPPRRWRPVEVRGPAEFGKAFAALGNKKVQGLVVGAHQQFLANASAIAELASKGRLPSIGSLELATNGGLMAYGVNFADQWRRAAMYVDKILKGANPADLPIEQATKFLLALNARTAKTLGVAFQHSLILRAEEVIE